MWDRPGRSVPWAFFRSRCVRSTYRRCCTSCICCPIGATPTSRRSSRWRSARAGRSSGRRRAGRPRMRAGESRRRSNNNPSTCGASSSRPWTALRPASKPIARPVPSSGPIPEPVREPPPRKPVWPWALGAAAVCLLAVMAVAMWLSRADLLRTHQELAALKVADADLKQSTDQLSSTVRISRRLLRRAGISANRSQCLWRTGRRCARRSGACRRRPHRFATRGHRTRRRIGAAPLRAGSVRRAAVRPWPPRCATRGIGQTRSTEISRRGEGHQLAGRRSASPATPPMDSLRPAPSLPAAKCDLVGNPFEESLVRPAAAVARVCQSGGRRAPAHRRRITVVSG